MNRFLIHAGCLAFLAGTVPCQVAAEEQPVAQLFYRAFFTERGLEQPDKALELYITFLEAAPEHELAGHAARAAIELLRDAGKTEAASALQSKHAAAMERTPPLGINASFVDAEADVDSFVKRFESESREVFEHREKIVELVGLEAGQEIADIGAGTGFFAELFAGAVGPEGKVYAVELGPRLFDHLGALAADRGLTQLVPVLCDERSTKLPPDSVDAVFICDTYHHFSYPSETLASIHQALRPGGQLVVIEFERIPGVSREWLLQHVRAGKEVFRSEIEAAGFDFAGEEDAPFLEENYFIRFRK